MLSARLTGGCIAQASQISVGLQRSERVEYSFTISFFFFFATREITHPHSSTFLKVLLWEGEKKASRQNEKEKLMIKTEGTMHYLLLWLQFCAFPFLT